MYTPPPPPQPVPPIVQRVEPPKTLEQLGESFQADGYNINFPQESASSTFQQPVEPEKSEPSDLEKVTALNENIGDIAGSVAEPYEKKGEIDEKVGTGNASEVAAGSSDPPEQSQEATKEQEPASEQNTSPKQAESAAPSESNGESGSSTPSADDGYDRYNGIGY